MNEKRFRDVKDRIFYRIMNTELNRVLLDTAPSIELPEFGMSKVFFVFLEEDELGAKSLLVNQPIADILSYSVEELNHFAERNTFKLFPSTAIPFADIKGKILELEFEECDIEIDIEFYVMTNQFYDKGAHAMFNSDFLDGFAKGMAEEKLYILPMSEHEVLVVRGSQVNGKKDVQMMKDCLRSLADDMQFHSDMLSYQCVIYDVESRQYSVA